MTSETLTSPVSTLLLLTTGISFLLLLSNSSASFSSVISSVKSVETQSAEAW